ncbi:ATP synthase F1 subunit delta [Falsiroseomonas stagni]|uniref:ATP synthase subunit delta n=1 Tax=Falsiroseomonas stagni DSM 19981 TaxID=1123062 RepID=A0A1I3XMQ8_9PROT|nr:ATP synthase F1 subunit delta [Falsiroseomonas stagni]SFK20832.1 ATP synthase F1 subcomplex delta subunit [Falsiroseomonas stagni DSM 19981]
MASAAINADSASTKAPNPTGLSERYALALFGIVDDLRQGEPGAADRIAKDLETLFALWRDDAGFRSFVADPRYDAAEQKRAAFAVLERAGIGTEVRNLLGVLIINRRLSKLPEVAASFGALLAARRGQQIAEVATAHPLSDTQRAQITARLTEAGYSGVQLRESVDATLLGGLVIRIGSRLYDNSLKSKLQRLQYAMKGAA